MAKQPDGMYSTSSFTDLTVHRTGHKNGSKEVVVTCGYTNDGRFGYFIVDEELVTDRKTKKQKWSYTNQRAFVQKKNEQAYKDILAQVQRIIS